MKRAHYAVRVVLWTVLLLPTCLVLAACGAQGTGSPSGGGVRGAGEDVAMSEGGGPVGEEMVPQEAQDAVSGPDVPSSGGGASAGPGETLAATDGLGAKVIKTAEVGLRAEDVRGVAEAAQRVASGGGGSVLHSEISGSEEDRTSAYMTLSVPAERFEETLEALRGLGREVVRDTVSGQDVTEEFVDLESRERNLLAAERSLLELYGRAESVEDTLTVERELTNIRGQIEEVQGRLQYLENRTSYAQISVLVEPVAAPKPKPAGWEPLSVAADAWRASLAVLQGAASAAIAALAFGWWAAPLLVGGYLWWRRRRGPAASPTEA